MQTVAATVVVAAAAPVRLFAHFYLSHQSTAHWLLHAYCLPLATGQCVCPADFRHTLTVGSKSIPYLSAVCFSHLATHKNMHTNLCSNASGGKKESMNRRERLTKKGLGVGSGSGWWQHASEEVSQLSLLNGLATGL